MPSSAATSPDCWKLSPVIVTVPSMADGQKHPSPYRAFRRGRRAVDRHVARVLQAGEMWAEETATDLLLEKTWPDVWHRKFTRKRESVVGADWLWWWIDASGTSFGLLTQAKVLKRKGPRWHIDFDYRPKGADSTQIDTLIDASRVFDVPAAHVLY